MKVMSGQHIGAIHLRTSFSDLLTTIFVTITGPKRMILNPLLEPVGTYTFKKKSC